MRKRTKETNQSWLYDAEFQSFKLGMYNGSLPNKSRKRSRRRVENKTEKGEKIGKEGVKLTRARNKK